MLEPGCWGWRAAHNSTQGLAQQVLSAISLAALQCGLLNTDSLRVKSKPRGQHRGERDCAPCATAAATYTGSGSSAPGPSGSAALHCGMRNTSRPVSSPWSCFIMQV